MKKVKNFAEASRLLIERDNLYTAMEALQCDPPIIIMIGQNVVAATRAEASGIITDRLLLNRKHLECVGVTV